MQAHKLYGREPIQSVCCPVTFAVDWILPSSGAAVELDSNGHTLVMLWQVAAYVDLAKYALHNASDESTKEDKLR